MRFLLIVLLIAIPVLTSGQKREGVYVGEVITEANALVITVKGESVNGNVYLTQYEKFAFVGNFKVDSLKGVILVPGGQEVVVLGKLFLDSLSLDLHMDGTMRHTRLNRISSKPNYDLTKYFGKHEPDRDPLLRGKWQLVRSVDGESNKINTNGSYFYEYLANGSMKIDVEHMKSMMSEYARMAGVKFTFDPRFIPQMSWRTSQSKLITTSMSEATGQSENSYDYTIMNDTLTLTNFKGGREVMVRDAKKK